MYSSCRLFVIVLSLLPCYKSLKAYTNHWLIWQSQIMSIEWRIVVCLFVWRLSYRLQFFVVTSSNVSHIHTCNLCMYIFFLDVIKYYDHPKRSKKLLLTGGNSDRMWTAPIGGITSNLYIVEDYHSKYPIVKQTGIISSLLKKSLQYHICRVWASKENNISCWYKFCSSEISVLWETKHSSCSVIIQSPKQLDSYPPGLSWFDVDFSFCWFNLEVGWYSLEQNIWLKF